jgi:hypothetical protein
MPKNNVHPNSLANLGKPRTKSGRFNFTLGQHSVDWLNQQQNKSAAIDALIREEAMLSIKFILADCNRQAQELLKFVADQDFDGDIVDLKLYSRSRDYWLIIWVDTTIGSVERIKTWGVPDANFSLQELGHLRYTSPGMVIPDDDWINAHVSESLGMFGDIGEKRYWKVPFSLLRQISTNRLSGYKAWNAISREFWDWCKKGKFEPIPH